MPNTMQRDATFRQSPNGLVLPLPSPLLAMLPPELQECSMQWYVEPIQILGVAPLAAGNGSFTTDKNHAFAAFYGSLKVRSSDNQTDRDDDPAAFVMTDTQNQQYSQTGVLLDKDLVWGSAKQPAIWPVPLIVRQNSGIVLNVTNQDTVNTNNYNFGFIGVLIDVTGVQFG